MRRCTTAGRRVLAAACDEVLVVGKPGELPFDVLDDGTEVRAPIAGVVAGLRAAANDVAVFLPVDCPRVTPELVRRARRCVPRRRGPADRAAARRVGEVRAAAARAAASRGPARPLSGLRASSTSPRWRSTRPSSPTSTRRATSPPVDRSDSSPYGPAGSAGQVAATASRSASRRCSASRRQRCSSGSSFFPRRTTIARTTATTTGTKIDSATMICVQALGEIDGGHARTRSRAAPTPTSSIGTCRSRETNSTYARAAAGRSSSDAAPSSGSDQPGKVSQTAVA